MAQKALWNITKKGMLEDRGALPREDGDSPREYQAIHGEHWKVKVEKERRRENGKGLRLKSICLDRLSSEVFEVLCSDSEVKSVRDSWVLRCVCVWCLLLCLI